MLDELLTLSLSSRSLLNHLTSLPVRKLRSNQLEIEKYSLIHLLDSEARSFVHQLELLHANTFTDNDALIHMYSLAYIAFDQGAGVFTS